MLKALKYFALFEVVVSLAACTTYNPHGYPNYQAYAWEQGAPYPEGYSEQYPYRDQPQEPKPVIVPETYHVGSYHSPTRAKDRDRTWVTSQNPSGYTIELSQGEKASSVAGKLHQAPKSNRRAQVKYDQNGRTYYKGLYGSYPSYEAARQALNTLPDTIKGGAKIQSWGSVQNGIRP